ncbi:MAG: CpsB/CapC family capsule biosynthesis tyrosine phosphatase [Rikenellaceae bacterium]
MFNLKSLFSAKKNSSIPKLEIDYHIHLLPGVDDGVESSEDAMMILAQIYNSGIREIYLTPHCYHPIYKNDYSSLEPIFVEFKTLALSKFPDLKLYLAGECRISQDFLEAIERGDKLPTYDGKTILIENSFIESSDYLEDVLYQLESRGYSAVMAHPERYPYWSENFDNYKELKERGLLFQVNIGSLTGRYGKGVKQCAERLIKEGYASYFGSDLHGERHLTDIIK